VTPSVALSLCGALILALLLVDRRRGEPVSAAIWLPTAWVVYAGSRPLAYWFDPELIAAGNSDLTDGSPVDRAFLSSLMLVAVIILSRRGARVRAIVADNAWLVALFGYMAISVVWSDYPDVSVKRWVKTVGDVASALVILTEVEPLHAMTAVFRRSAIVLLPSSLVLIKYFGGIGTAYSDDGLQRMWIGATTQKNVLGYVTMVCGLLLVSGLLARRLRRSLLEAFLLGLALWLLIGSSTAGSKTALIGFVVGTLMLIGAQLSLRQPAKIIGALLAIAVLSWIGLATSEGSLFESAANLMGRDATLTGRTDIWNAVLEVGPRDPVFGRGYGSFWYGEVAREVWKKPRIYTTIQQSHNGYLDIYLELGMVGLALLTGLVWATHRDILRALGSEREFAGLRMAILCVILVHNIAESSFGRPVHLLWFLFILVCIRLPRRGGSPSRLFVGGPGEGAPRATRRARAAA
jgi:O-antigen ligase